MSNRLRVHDESAFSAANIAGTTVYVTEEATLRGPAYRHDDPSTWEFTRDASGRAQFGIRRMATGTAFQVTMHSERPAREGVPACVEFRGSGARVLVYKG